MHFKNPYKIPDTGDDHFTNIFQELTALTSGRYEWKQSERAKNEG